MSKLSNPKVHNVRFYKPKPRAIYCMALQLTENKIAISRADASLEIWNLTHSPFIERTVPPSTENFSIEGLAWCDTRLFSVGLHGLLVEYDLHKLDIKNRAVVTGDAAFCLDVNREKTRIAIGTEQGYLNIFQINEDEVLFEKFLDKQEGRILCLKFDSSGEYIVSGSLDAIRIWSVNSNQALHKMITGRSEHNKPTIVWCLTVTDDFTIISGDSRGILTVWDGKVGAQLESYQSHRADILSICLSDDQTSLYCAGIDPNIVNYVRINVKDGAQKWVRSLQRKIHDHDIRALVLHNNKLYSGGVDGYLACSYHPPKTLLKYPPLLQNPCVTICSKARYVMLRYPKSIELWSIGEVGSEKDKDTGLFEMVEKPKKLVILQKVVEVDEGVEKKEGIKCATASDDGKFIMYSTRLGIRLLKISYEETTPKLKPIELNNDLGEVSCSNAVFTLKNELILAPNVGGLMIVKFDSSDTPVVSQEISTQSEIEDIITLLAVSNDSNFLVAGDVKGNISVWTMKNKNYTFWSKLPKYKLCPTTLAIHPKVSNLIVAYSNGQIIEYDLNKRGLTKFSRIFSQNPPKQMRTPRFSVIRNISFDPRTNHLIILSDDESIVIIDKNKKSQEESTKIQKLENATKGDEQYAVRVIKKYKHLVHLSWLSSDEMLVVEVNPLSLIEQLPPCLVQNTFGRK